MRKIYWAFVVIVTAFSFPSYAANRPSGYTTICKNDQTCTLAATSLVAFGRNDQFTYKTLSGTFVCSEATFGAGTFVAGGINECSIPTSSTSSVSTSKSSSSAVSSALSSSSVAVSSVSSSAASSSVANTACTTPSASKTYYVSRNGTANGAGTSFSSPLDLASALTAVKAGEMLLLEAGTYSIPYTSGQANTIILSKSGTASAPIRIVAANCGKAVIDFSFPEQAWVQDSHGFRVTGSYWYFRGIEVTRAGYQGVYVTGKYNTFENCAFHHNRNTGLEINEGGAYTTVINSDAYRNYDPKKNGSMADGFGPKQTQGPGNKFVGCRAWENSDDGFDLFDSPQVVVIESSWAFRNGVDVWNYGSFAGNGNGFKLGGNKTLARNKISNSVAFDNPTKGFDQNNNSGGLTLLNNTAYRNGLNYGLGNPVTTGEKHYLRNNVSLSGATSIANADAKYNSWDTGPSAIIADFMSVDTSLATAPRNADGSLPTNNLFRLTSTSALIDKGVNVGITYLGVAPDLGAFEKK